MDLCNLLTAKYGDVAKVIEQYLANNDSEYSKYIKRVRDLIIHSVEPDRKAELNVIVVDIYTVYSKLFYCRSTNPNQYESYEVYAAPLVSAMSRILSFSFNVEYRKLQILFGMTKCLADLLVFDVHAFHFRVDCQNNRNTCACRTIRRCIANTLINLTYRQRECKLFLCAQSDFIECVTEIITNTPFLAQCYAGLIRNLSWNTDEKFARQVLEKTVPALVQASLAATDQKCLLSLLSALWNLAPHSTRNKRTMCGSRPFLALLCVLIDDLRQDLMIESASGVLKYLCIYIRDDPPLRHFLVVEHNIISRLLNLLQSSTFTAIVHALNALYSLISRDELLKIMLARDEHAMRVIGHLRKTNREDVSNAAKTLLDDLLTTNLTNAYARQRQPRAQTLTRSYFDASQTSPFGANYANNCRTLGPNFQRHGRQSAASLPESSDKQIAAVSDNLSSVGTLRSSRLRTHCSGSSASSTNTMSRVTALAASTVLDNGNGVTMPSTAEPTNQLGLQSTQGTVAMLNDGAVMEPSLDTGEDLTESMQCTASGSVESLVSFQHNDEWPSTITTASNSGTQSPASGTELPDSPSHCSVLRDFENLRLAMAASPGAEPLQCSTSSTSNGGGGDAVGSRCDENEVDEQLLADMIDSMLPKQTLYRHPVNNVESDGLLDECIASVMPTRGGFFAISSPLFQPPPAANGVGDDSQLPIDWDDSQADDFHHQYLSTRTNDVKRSTPFEQSSRPLAVADGCGIMSSSSEDNFNFVEAKCVDAAIPDDVHEYFRRVDPLGSKLVTDCSTTAYKCSGGYSTSSNTTLANFSTNGSAYLSPTKLQKPSVIPRKTTLRKTSPRPLSANESTADTLQTRLPRPPIAPKPKLAQLAQHKSRTSAN